MLKINIWIHLCINPFHNFSVNCASVHVFCLTAPWAFYFSSSFESLHFQQCCHFCHSAPNLTGAMNG